MNVPFCLVTKLETQISFQFPIVDGRPRVRAEGRIFRLRLRLHRLRSGENQLIVGVGSRSGRINQSQCTFLACDSYNLLFTWSIVSDGSSRKRNQNAVFTRSLKVLRFWLYLPSDSVASANQPLLLTIPLLFNILLLSQSRRGGYLTDHFKIAHPLLKYLCFPMWVNRDLPRLALTRCKAYLSVFSMVT